MKSDIFLGILNSVAVSISEYVQADSVGSAILAAWSWRLSQNQNAILHDSASLATGVWT